MQAVLAVCGRRKHLTQTSLNQSRVMKPLTYLIHSTRALSVLFAAASVLGFAVQLATPAVAQTPSQSLMPVFGNASGSAALSSLILSPAQRRALETMRSNPGKTDDEVRVLSGTSGESSSGLPDKLVVTGMVVRSGNRSTVWVNDEPLYGQASSTPLRTLAGQAGVLVPGGRDLQIKAKPGQVIDVPSGQAVDILPPGSIRINPPKINASGGVKRE
jgi:hypothetical protein